MRFYLAPSSSITLMRYLRSTNGEEKLMGTPVRKKTLNDAANTKRAMDELDEEAQRWLKHAGSPVHVYVGDRSKGVSTKHLVAHVLSEPVPSGAFLDLGHGICICTPQFALLRIASQCDLIDTIDLGMELCGTYSRWRMEPSGFGDPIYREHNETRACTFNIPAVMQAKRMNAFATRLAQQRGSRDAQAALRWIIDHSASPMETAVYLLLCLPKRLGGFGLPKPVLNPKLTISNPDGTKERYPDLFWAGPNIDVEYNSDSSHSGEWARYRDSKREIELVVADVRVLPLTRPQVMGIDEFDSFARGLQRMLGVRARGQNPDWAYRHAQLHRRLLASWN